nr:hypothetical protein [Tanacetum cinerariifolium]
MAKSKNEVYDDSYCSKSCRKNTKDLNTKINKLNEKLSDSVNTMYHYKLGLSQVKKEKEGLDSKLIGFESASKDLDTLLGSQRSDKNKEGLGCSDVPPPSCSKNEESASSIMSKPMIKFVKAAESLEVIKTNKVETARKSSVKYAEMYINTSKSPKVR